MKIAMVQVYASTQDMAANYNKIAGHVREASEQGVTCICFPELTLTGYDLNKSDETIDKQYDYLEALRTLAEQLNMTILVGGIERDGTKRYIAQFVLHHTIESYRKIHIGNKEKAYVTPGEKIHVFQSRGLTFGIMVCYDTHFPELASIMTRMGAQVIFAPSASPNDPRKRIEMWKKYMVARAYDNRITVLATNLIFGEKGGGMIGYDGRGELRLSLASLEDYRMIIDLKSYDFHKKGMRDRLFHHDRQPLIYQKAEETLVKSWNDS